jgi:hypothetical protein
MKRILIEWFHCDSKEPDQLRTCEKPELIRSTIEALRPFMRTMQVQLDFREVTLTGDETQRADTIKINGKKIEDLIDAESEKAKCGRTTDGRARRDPASVSSLCGASATQLCETLVDAILKESARFARSGCGCSPEDLCR